MSHTLQLSPIHHIRLTVTDIERSKEFYTQILGFSLAVDSPPSPEDPLYELTVENLQGGIVLSNDYMLLGLRPIDEKHRDSADHFNPFRVGLDHMSFSAPNREYLQQAADLLDEKGLSRGELTDLPMFGISVLPIQDPDGIQLELSAPLTSSA